MKHIATRAFFGFITISHALLPVAATLAAALVFAASTLPARILYEPTPFVQEPFSIIVMPDTQAYAESYPHIFAAQTTWIAAHKDTLNIQMVTHVGDIVNYPHLEEQWRVADSAMALLDGKVPYIMAPGNHDFTREGAPILYKKYFPLSRLSQGFEKGGGFGDKNVFRTFGVNDRQFLVMNLEFCPTDAVLEWAGKVLREHSAYQAIVTTHSMLNADGTRSDRGECDYFHNEGFNAGADIWRKLVEEQKNTNILLFLSGHNMPVAGGIRRIDMVNGSPIHQILANYQHFVNGGDGYLRIMTFVPATHKILVETYSPFNGQYLSDEQNFFELDWF